MNISMELDFEDQGVGRSREPCGISQQMDFSRVRSPALGFGRVMVELDIYPVHGVWQILLSFLMMHEPWDSCFLIT